MINFVSRNVDCPKYEKCLDIAAKKNLGLACGTCNPSKVIFDEAPIKQNIPMEEVIHVIQKEKKCSKCGETKSVDQFAKRISSPDGLQSQCKDCIAKYYRDHRPKGVVPKSDNGRKHHRIPKPRPVADLSPKIDEAIYLPPESIKALRNAGIKEVIKILERSLA